MLTPKHIILSYEQIFVLDSVEVNSIWPQTSNAVVGNFSRRVYSDVALVSRTIITYSAKPLSLLNMYHTDNSIPFVRHEQTFEAKLHIKNRVPENLLISLSKFFFGKAYVWFKPKKRMKWKRWRKIFSSKLFWASRRRVINNILKISRK